jgi:1-acyl-sn-glycerol-3-phosphate acyltransferase
VAESIVYRSIVVATQCASWVCGQLLRLRYSVRAEFPSGDFRSSAEHCLIFAPMHKTVLDPCLLMIALDYRRWRALVPIRTLATQTFVGPLRWLNWFKPLIKIIYRLEGVIELPPESHEKGFHPEKVRGLLVALNQGDVIAIFPEGEIWRKREPPVGEFAPGVVYLQRKSGAPIVSIAVWMSNRSWPRRRYVIRFGEPVQIPDHLDFDAGAAWLREYALALSEQISQNET